MSSHVYIKKLVANAVPESTKMSTIHAVNVFEGVVADIISRHTSLLKGLFFLKDTLITARFRAPQSQIGFHAASIERNANRFDCSGYHQKKLFMVRIMRMRGHNVCQWEWHCERKYVENSHKH